MIEGAPTFVRFARALALISGPFVPASAIVIPAFVEGALISGCGEDLGPSCVSNTCYGASDTGTSADTGHDVIKDTGSKVDAVATDAPADQEGTSSDGAADEAGAD